MNYGLFPIKLLGIMYLQRTEKNRSVKKMESLAPEVTSKVNREEMLGPCPRYYHLSVERKAMPEKPPVILTIAGFDPSSGAGVTADIKTIAAHGCYGVACITALTVQSTSGVKRVEVVDPALVSETLEELAEDIEIAAVHIGMLGSGKVVKAVADFLSGQSGRGGSRPGERAGKAGLPNVVLDPILKSSSGTELLDAAGTRVLIERLIPLADVLTPNIDEAAAITGIQVRDLEEMKTAAAKLHEMGAAAVVITGGHLDKAIDLLSFKSRRGVDQEVFKAERQRSNSTHGTGCAFATAIACHLALDRGLAEATLLAKTYVTAAISNGHPLGKGTDPVHHLYRMSQQRRAAGSGSET
jgi:hydroxymethylpyrimidine/phosphomethylpyrimidine kinase